MSFGQSIKSVFRQYATFTGRARRSEYWWFALFNFLVSLPAQVLFFVVYFREIWPAITAVDSQGNPSGAALNDINVGAVAASYIPMLLVSLALLLPGLAVVVRRLHDTGRSGWWYWISLVPFVGIALLVFMFLDGQAYDNQYGPDPKAGERASGGYPPQGYGQPGYPAQPPTPAGYPAPQFAPLDPPAQYPPLDPPPAPPAAPQQGPVDPFAPPHS